MQSEILKERDHLSVGGGMLKRVLMTIMPMGWEYVSELRPQTGQLFIPQVIHDHGEPQCNDIDKEKLIRLPELSGNPSNRVI
jgi:hypothetical protein